MWTGDCYQDHSLKFEEMCIDAGVLFEHAW